jgi:hypothetical protein
MAELQQTRGPVPKAPTAPDAPAIAGGTNATPIAAVDLSHYSANQLQRMLSELRRQRQDLADRRQTIGGAYETATGDNRAGIGQRLQILDQNLANYESEIGRVGRQLAVKTGGEATTTVQTGRPPGDWIREDEFAGWMAANFFITATVIFMFTRRMFRRKFGHIPPAQQQSMIGSTERLDRIEQAVDTIAVEIERVSENQRFMTRLMTETQLGDTIKDVRKSTELARSAAESGG